MLQYAYPYLLLLTLISTTTATHWWPLPPQTPTLYLRYPPNPWISPGDTLKMSQTTPLPEISTLGLPTENTYLLLFLDLDVVYGSTSTVVLHWYQPNMTANTTDPIIFNNTLAGETAEYISPRPPPNTRHRYVYLLYEQDPMYVFPDCFAYIFPSTPEARAGFDVRQFVNVAALGMPVAGNYFYVDRDVPWTVTGTEVGTGVPTTTSFRSAPCWTGQVKAVDLVEVCSGGYERGEMGQIVM